ncbi:hypothetical protein PVK06_025523 [Gossypium arboreum]|uniref:Uncharacterized protein n=1 Tax=Gossypium arboreum TaxID=29729 RepID=A0ABR0PGR8_GOSAR|nr:hypothetical protein PVK06_025523 [Gossypium arboreum]
MLASVIITLCKQLESSKTTKVIIEKLEDMFGGQDILARKSTITSLMNAQQEPSTPIKDHMITLGREKHTKRNKIKSSRPPKVEKKRTKKPKDISKYKKARFKANCKERDEHLAIKGIGV